MKVLPFIVLAEWFWYFTYGLFEISRLGTWSGNKYAYVEDWNYLQAYILIVERFGIFINYFSPSYLFLAMVWLCLFWEEGKIFGCKWWLYVLACSMCTLKLESFCFLLLLLCAFGLRIKWRICWIYSILLRFWVNLKDFKV